MSSETALTGRLGAFKVDGYRVARSTQWSVNPKLAHKSEWGDSDSLGYTNRAPGRFDCSFSTEGKFDTEAQQFDLFMPGDVLVAGLFMNASLYWYFARALCDDFKLMVNIDTEEVIGWSADWGPDGIFFKPGQSGIPTFAP